MDLALAKRFKLSYTEGLRLTVLHLIIQTVQVPVNKPYNSIQVKMILLQEPISDYFSKRFYFLCLLVFVFYPSQVKAQKISEIFGENFQDSSFCFIYEWGSTTEEHYIHQSGSFNVAIDGKVGYFGQWSFSGDTIYEYYSHAYGFRGIGEPADLIGNTEIYDLNIPFVYFIGGKEKGFLLWKEIVDGVQKGSNLYKIIPSRQCEANTTPPSLPGQYPMLSYQKLPDSFFENRNEEELRLMRNEIFARYGYIFRSRDLASHFEKESWYRKVFDEIPEDVLTDIEKYNIKRVQEAEKE